MSEVLQRLDYYVCGIGFTQQVLDIIQENPQEFNEFITLVNGAINCETINACGPVPTTTTTSTTEVIVTTTTTTTISEFICFCIFVEGEGCGFTIELPILGNAPFQNGRPVYNFTGDVNGSVYYNGSQWVFNNTEFSPLLQLLDNSNYYPIGSSSEWGDVNITGLINSSTSGPCPITTTTTSSTSTTTTTTTLVPLTTTTTTSGLGPMTTTTTTTDDVITYESFRSSSSDSVDACSLELTEPTYIIGFYSKVSDNISGIPGFNGGLQYWKVKRNIDAIPASVLIDTNGNILSISFCP